MSAVSRTETIDFHNPNNCQRSKITRAFPTALPHRHMHIQINRAPVLTLWAAVVAERLGFDWQEALTLGRAVAGLNAYAKGVRLGLFTPSPPEVREKRKKLRPKETITVD